MGKHGFAKSAENLSPPTKIKGDGINDPSFYGRHLREEVVSAHRALDKHGAPVTRRVPNREMAGEHEISIGLADRIDALVEQLKHGK